MASQLPAPIRPLRWRTLLAFSAPVFPFAGQEIAFRIFLPIYLTQATHFSIRAIATIFLVFRVWETLGDPIVGWCSDHWRHGHRRFVPMLLGTPLALVGIVAVLLAPQAFSPAGITVVLVATALGWTMVNAPHGAWSLELVPDPVQRTRVFAARQVVGLLALPLFVLGPGLLEHIYGTDSRRDAIIFAGIIAMTLPASLLWMASVIPQVPRRAASDCIIIKLAALRAAFAQRQSLFLLALFACLGVHNEVRDGLILFWVRDTLHLANWGWSILLLQAGFGAVSMPLWLKLQARFGTLQALQVSLGATAIVTLGFILVPRGSLAALLVFMMAQGVTTSAAFILIRTLLGDHFDQLVAHRGVNLAGTLYSGFHFAYNLAVALTLPAALAVLTALGFDPRAASIAAASAFDPLPWVLGCGGSLPIVVAAFLVHRRRQPKN